MKYKSMRAVINVRQVNKEDIDICCVYPLHKSIRLKDFIINKDENSKKFCVIGVGSGGLNIVEEITQSSYDYHPLIVNQVHQLLKENKVANKLLLMPDTDIDAYDEAELFSAENKRALSEFVSSHERVYVVTTLGRKTIRSQAVPKIVKHLKKIGRKVTLIIVKPFLFEVTPGRIRGINASIEQMAKDADKIFVFHNEDTIEIKGFDHISIGGSLSLIDKAIALLIENHYTAGDSVVTNLRLNDFLKEMA